MAGASAEEFLRCPVIGPLRVRVADVGREKFEKVRSLVARSPY